MSIQQFPLLESGKEDTSRRKQIIMILQNVDPLNPVVRFVPDRCAKDGWNPFDIDLSTVTGGKSQEVSIRVVILQDDLTFMTGDADVTAGCELSQKYLQRVSSRTSEPARDLEFLVAPLKPGDPDLHFNLGLIASGSSKDCDDKPVRWSLPIVLDPKVRNM
jgi:hypothetical protein